MSLDMEDEFVGTENHLVPKVDAGEYCNAKRTKDTQDPDDGTRTIFQGYCNNKAGKGTEHVGEGRCKFHGGAGQDSPDNGAPEHNQNNLQHGMNVDPHHYTENLPKDEEEWIERVTAEILDRVRRIHGREPDFVDRTLARLVTIELHIAYKATDYTKDELVQVILHDGGSHEEPGALVKEVRQYTKDIFGNLSKLGVMEDPESKKANSLDEWRNYIQGNDEEVEITQE